MPLFIQILVALGAFFGVLSAGAGVLNTFLQGSYARRAERSRTRHALSQKGDLIEIKAGVNGEKDRLLGRIDELTRERDACQELVMLYTRRAAEQDRLQQAPRGIADGQGTC